MQIKKVPQEEGSTESVFQVEDESTLQGVFYLTVDKEEKKLTLYSISEQGDMDSADALMLAARIGLENAQETEGGYAWDFATDEELTSMLTQVVGEHSEILTRDLGLPEPSQDDFDAALAQDGAAAKDDHETPAAADVVDMEFEFDPNITAGDVGPGGANDANLDPSDPNGDMSAPGDEPPPEDGSIDLENPVPPEDEEEAP